ncbi:quinoprotein dehydrogenase-associated SoxYZ-like carrier [Methylocystis sp. JAN1]|uniref:quinoprotein dehydrogenase-associated SoxYZ-like carrier n=1 Tax=Methylocystis sp. JAN1 TaxID=3397211 RepID=UPI003FA23A6B
MSRTRAALAAVLLAALAPSALAESNAPDPWPGLVTDIFHGRQVAPADGTVSLEAPKRAEDAAIVPMTMRFADPAKVKSATLVIDQNPMPMAASFTLGDKAGVDFIETRVRVNSYTNVHAVAETQDGKLHSEVKFVKASGGCSTPAGKDPDEALANMGKMKYREFRSAVAGRREAQVMIRHPNNSGMQMDQITRAYTPAHYVDAVEVWQGDELIFRMEGGISLSEDPNFRFTYAPNGAKTMRVVAHDNKGGVYKGEWPIAEPS